MCTLKKINYYSEEYRLTLELRNKVMRKPLGLDIYNEDFSCEKDSIVIGAFDNTLLLGVGVLSNKNDIYKLEYLCVDTDIQSSGIGSKILRKLEEIAIENKASKICIDARKSASNLYQRHGYKEIGDIFFMDIAPVEHIYMEKSLISILIFQL